MKGFLVPDLLPAMGEKFFAEVPKLVAEGKLKSEEIIVKGLKNAPQAFVDMLHGAGDDAGKPVVEVSAD
jgi:NADPH-dependent curcumin reductase CurA